MEDSDSLVPSFYPSRPSGRVPQTPVQQHRFTLLWSFLTAISVSVTVFFAYNSSLDKPVSSRFIFTRPERTIFVLNVLTQITIFCLTEVTLTVFDALRWVFASSSSGISAPTFLVMSRATNITGVLCLVMGR